VDESLMEQYLRFRAHYQRPFYSDRPALCRFLGLLRRIGAIAPPTPAPPKPLEQIEQDFEHYLLRERGLSRTTVIRHRPPLRKFLQEYCSEGPESFSRLTAADVVRFVAEHAHDHSPRTAKSMCWTLRAFTRYLVYRGHIVDDLAAAVPSVRSWRFGPLPGYLSSSQVQLVLDSCDRTTAIWEERLCGATFAGTPRVEGQRGCHTDAGRHRLALGSPDCTGQGPSTRRYALLV
jgi:integrase